MAQFSKLITKGDISKLKLLMKGDLTQSGSQEPTCYDLPSLASCQEEIQSPDTLINYTSN